MMKLFIRDFTDNPYGPEPHADAGPADVYMVKFEGSVYVLHCFQKKSKRASKTAKADIDRIEQRLRAAQKHYAIGKAL